MTSFSRQVADWIHPSSSAARRLRPWNRPINLLSELQNVKEPPGLSAQRSHPRIRPSTETRRGPGRPGPPSVMRCAWPDLGLVAAGAVLHRVAEVLALAAVAFIRSIAALEHVGTAQPDQQVVALAALERVVGGRAGQDV